VLIVSRFLNWLIGGRPSVKLSVYLYVICVITYIYYSRRFNKRMVSIIIAAYNAEKFLSKVLDSIYQQTRLPDEIIIVDDGSSDNTREIAEEYKDKASRSFPGIGYHLIVQKNKGPAAASNVAIKNAKGEYIVSVDSDAIVDRDLIEKCVHEMETNQSIGAVGGYIRTANKDKFWARIMGYDIEYRYDHIGGLQAPKAWMSHISPCNTLYRKEVFDKIGGFSETFGHTHDVDFSYRLTAAGYKILLLKTTGCEHYSKESFSSYIRQNYKYAYGRMMLVSKKVAYIKGDSVAGGPRMMMQVPLTGLGLLGLVAGMIYPTTATIGCITLAILLIERSSEAIYIVRQKKDKGMALMPFIHLLRNVAWGIGCAKYVTDRLIRKITP
jgi:GT2 family glycosyltransferase